MAGPAGDTAAVHVRGLLKRYGDLRAVDGLDLTIERGDVFALLGPNGAGKSTTIEVLEGYRRRDGGEVRVLGLDPGHERIALKPRIGVVLQSTGVDQYLTVRETISMYSGYYPHPRPVDEVIELVGLGEKRNARVTKLSGGQQRRLDVGIALAGDPELLFLDEPTTGFDPSARREAWQIVRDLASLGKTVLLTTHYMDEAEHLANRLAVIARGKIIAEGTPRDLGGPDRGQVLVRYRLPAGTAPEPGLGQPSGDGWVEYRPADVTSELHRLTGWALDHGISLDALEVTRPTLEDLYLRLTDGNEGG